MQLCIFNPEHDLCLASGRAHYLPPRSAREFALRDAQAVMGTLYPAALCCSAYSLPPAEMLRDCTAVVPWGWNIALKHQLLKAGLPQRLLPSDAFLEELRRLQHRSTVLPLQPDCRAIYSPEEAEALLQGQPHWVLKAPWSGAGRGLRWIHGALTAIDRHWIAKTVTTQRCVIAEPRREVVADLALEYMGSRFIGYSLFRTGSGVYKENILWPDSRIAAAFPALEAMRGRVEAWLAANITPRYTGPLGVDLMACADGSLCVAEINLRHTMGMVAHCKVEERS
ncbi:MAG: hypothetical protein J6I49_09710 [Bacteroidales bacterium]|nr:hypothetical protein [Bacteroidales bacterium]